MGPSSACHGFGSFDGFCSCHKWDLEWDVSGQWIVLAAMLSVGVLGDVEWDVHGILLCFRMARYFNGIKLDVNVIGYLVAFLENCWHCWFWSLNFDGSFRDDRMGFWFWGINGDMSRQNGKNSSRYWRSGTLTWIHPILDTRVWDCEQKIWPIIVTLMGILAKYDKIGGSNEM